MSKFITKIQNITGTTLPELRVTILILVGLFGGFLITNYFSEDIDTKKSHISYYDILDSLAEEERKTFTGANNHIDSSNLSQKQKSSVEQQIRTFNNPKKKELDENSIDLNIASKLELMDLPGVGEITALKIIEYRKNNTFTYPEQIMEIKGIGPKKFDKIKKYLQFK